jgi:hypothetical protein
MLKKQSRKNAAPNPYRSSTSPDDLGPANRIAFDIVAERRDLLPSVERIMNAGLAEEDTVRAITMFRDALGADGDPNRDPRVAIARCTPAGGVAS